MKRSQYKGETSSSSVPISPATGGQQKFEKQFLNAENLSLALLVTIVFFQIQKADELPETRSALLPLHSLV